jgi:hypothetical protein
MRSLPMLLLAGALATSACAPATIPSASLTRHLTAPRQLVHVANHRWDNMELFAIRGGSRIVIGTIAAAQNATLAVPEDMLDSDGRLHLGARIEGSRDVLLMQPMRIPNGNFADWSLENNFARSTLAYFPL